MKKPRVIVSRCIEFENCRWNGLRISSEVVNRLKAHVDFQPVCPEVEIGLGIPRNPIRIVDRKGNHRLLQSDTEADITERMTSFASSFLEGVGEVDGFILKSRSPSCGMKDVKLYPAMGKVVALRKRTAGFFAREVLKHFPHLPVEDEGRLTNFTIREHFITRLFAHARLRKLLGNPNPKALVDFQANNKFLLMAYHQGRMRELGRVVANHEGRPFDEVIAVYAEGFNAVFAKEPRPMTNINVLEHALGHFSDQLTRAERAFFMESLSKYKEGKLPLSVPLSVIKALIVRFGDEYLASQTYFNPYPEDLMDIKDSGLGRDY